MAIGSAQTAQEHRGCHQRRHAGQQTPNLNIILSQLKYFLLTQSRVKIYRNANS